ncbi:MAG: hypothetical protein KF902_06725 [Phycisphaeraceae bacterium]|nr:hypothetical protein [Phycisphaeraceae bacterium]
MQAGGGEWNPSLNIYDLRVHREYVYVPSGASGYVDEFICQIDRYQDLWYILQDVNYNVIAMTDAAGEVVRQHTFDPYGEILAAEDFDTHPGIKVGHQGLFFDRLETSTPAGGLISMSAAVQLQPGIFGLYQARNRVLLPRYGRWAQKDPNASGMLHASLWHDGETPMPELAGGLLDGVLTDGSNLFACVRNNPFNAMDPTGRSVLTAQLGGGSLLQGLGLSGLLTGVGATVATEGFIFGTLVGANLGLIGGATLYVVNEFGMPNTRSTTIGDKFANESIGWIGDDKWLQVYFAEGNYAAPHGEWWGAQPKVPNRGQMKHNGKSGKKKRIYTWDGNHGGEVEEFNGKGQHLGVRNPHTGERIKPAVPGRKIDL